MARDYYIETITGIAADGTMKALSNIEVKIKIATTSTLATIYTGRSGGTTHAAEFTISDATPGLIEFWAEKGEFDIYLHDANPITRIADKIIHWISNPIEDAAVGFDIGDIKFSSKSADHGRWLRLDGRQLSQGEVETALSLPAGGALDLVALLGTGTASKYGTAPTDKITLPDMRRSVPMMAGASGDAAGPSASLSVRPLKGSGSSGGVETVTLSASQSGLPAHIHAAGSLVNSSTTPTITASSSSQTPAITVSDPGHTHTIGSIAGNVGGSGSDLFRNGPNLFNTTSATTGITAKNAAHSHSISATQPAHSHTVSGSTAAVSSASAANAHENMPPYVVIGYAYIRV